MSATTFLRPIHAWFRLWDALAGPVARLAAVAAGSVVTAGALAYVGVWWLVASVAALLAWIGLAIAQEHDERIHLPADEAFARALTAAVTGEPLRLTVRTARGPSRAHPREPEVYVLAPAESSDGRAMAGWHIEVRRNADEVELSAGPDDTGAGDHIDAMWPSVDAVADAAAIAAALRAEAS